MTSPCRQRSPGDSMAEAWALMQRRESATPPAPLPQGFFSRFGAHAVALAPLSLDLHETR